MNKNIERIAEFTCTYDQTADRQEVLSELYNAVKAGNLRPVSDGLLSIVSDPYEDKETTTEAAELHTELVNTYGEKVHFDTQKQTKKVGAYTLEVQREAHAGAVLLSIRHRSGLRWFSGAASDRNEKKELYYVYDMLKDEKQIDEYIRTYDNPGFWCESFYSQNINR